MSANRIHHGGRFRHAALEREKAWYIFLKERSVFCVTSLGWSEGALPPSGIIFAIQTQPASQTYLGGRNSATPQSRSNNI